MKCEFVINCVIIIVCVVVVAAAAVSFVIVYRIWFRVAARRKFNLLLKLSKHIHGKYCQCPHTRCHKLAHA